MGLIYMRYTCIIVLLLFLASCDDDLSPCKKNREVVECVTNQDARLYYKSDLKSYVISYFIQGTIDSYHTGVVCSNDLADIEVDKQLDVDVIFSGCLLDDKNEIQPMSLRGGEEFFYLDITDIELTE